jgi:hypothetical protein
VTGLEDRVTRLEERTQNIREDVSQNSADIRQLSDWRSEMIGASNAITKKATRQYALYGVLITATNVGLSLWIISGK